MALRWYQQQAVDAVWDYLRHKDGAPCVVLPTGSGKTHVIAELCRQVVAWGGRAVVLAHVKELLQQTTDKLALCVDPDLVGVYSAGLDERTTHTPIVVAGIQSVYYRPEELGEFHLVVVDEAHLIPPNGTGRYRKFLTAQKTISPKARLVGLTATPYRMGCGWIVRDKVAEDELSNYDRLLDTIVYEASVDRLIADGTLSAVISRNARKSPDFSKVKTTRGDFDEGDIEKVLFRKNVLELACHEIAEETADRNKVVVFCNRRSSARKCAALLKNYDPQFDAAVVDGDTSKNDRNAIIKRFKNESVQTDLFGNESKPLKYVCNVGVLTTGFDAPNVDCVVMLRPTKSLALYQQIVGRGLRRAPNKANCLVLDYGGNVERHGPIDLPVVDAQTARTWKICPACATVVQKGYMVCPICGAEFPKPAPAQPYDPNAKLTERASGAAILSEQEEPVVNEYEIEDVEYAAHYKADAPPNKPPTLMVTYYHHRFGRPVREWLCPEHSGWARRRFETWWSSKSKTRPPHTVETCVLWAQNGALAVPTKIRTKKKPSERFEEIEWLEFSDLPDFDPANIKQKEESDFLDEFVVFDEFSQFSGAPAHPAPNSSRSCRDCFHWVPDDLNERDSYCSKFGTHAPPDGAGPNVCFEHQREYEELPF